MTPEQWEELRARHALMDAEGLRHELEMAWGTLEVAGDEYRRVASAMGIIVGPDGCARPDRTVDEVVEQARRGQVAIAEVRRLRAALEDAREALGKMDDLRNSQFSAEDAYETCVDLARAALAEPETGGSR